MKGWTKRRIALILALALLASQMSACKKETGPAGNKAVENNNPAISVDKDAQKPEETKPAAAEAPGVLEWLQENLENIHQSLLEGDYAKVIEQLLGVQDSLANNAHFNALLYIAYMGNGEESKAAALLANVDPSEFADAFLESAEALKGNADIEAIKRKLMDSMMELSQTNPAGFEAVAKIGANIQNSNPDDPTIYAARYIAALAMGDQAAIDAILAEAKAHGVTAETLSTAVVEYIETHNVTSVSVYDAERGITTTTVYNEQGQATKTEEEVKTDEGYTVTIRDSLGNLVATVYLDHDRNLLRREDILFHYVESYDPLPNLTIYYEGSSEMVFENGILTITYFDCDGQIKRAFTFDENGNAVSGYTMVEDEKVPVSDEQLQYMKTTLDEKGNIQSVTTARFDADGTYIGTDVVHYDYTANAAGELSLREERDTLDRIEEETKYVYEYLEFKEGFPVDGKNTETVSIQYDENGNMIHYLRIDHKNYYATTHTNDNCYELFYNEGVDGRLGSCHTVKSYTAKTDADGNIVPDRLTSISEFTYDSDGNKTEEATSYDENQRVSAVTKRINNCYISVTFYLYAEDGTLNEVVEQTYPPNETKIKNNATRVYYAVSKDSDGNEVRIKTQEDTYEYKDGVKAGVTTVLYAEDGETVTTELTYILDDEGNKQLTKGKTYTYKEDGSYQVVEHTYKDEQLTQKKITLYDTNERPTLEEVRDGNNICVSQTAYEYSEDGTVTKTTYRNFDEDGNPQTKEITTLDKDGRPVKTLTGEVGGNLISMTTYEYNEDGTGTKTTYGDIDEDGNPHTKEVTTLDAQNKPVETEVFDDYGKVSHTDYNYDSEGKLCRETTVFYDIDGETETSKQEVVYVDGKKVQATVEDLLTGEKWVDNCDGDKVLDRTAYVEVDGEYVIAAKYVPTYNDSGEMVGEFDQIYDDNGNIAREETYVYAEDGTPILTDATDYAYDEDGKLCEAVTVDYEADGETVKKEVYVQYDADGETVVYKEEAEYVDGELVKITQEDATQKVEQTFEDGLDGDIYIYNKVDDQWILDTISTPVYDGEDIVGKVDKSVDENGNISSEVEYVFDENDEDIPVRETEYTYDEDGNVTQTVETNYSYNEDGTLEGTTENTYDADGNLVDTKYFDADGNEIEKPEDLELAAEGTGEDSLNPAPEESEETEVPEETEEPAESEDGEDPTLPGIPEIPGLPDISDIPGLPDISDIPGLPDISDIPGLPDISDIPGLPDISDIPGLPDISDIPGLPDISEVPGMSDFLENMDYGQIAEYVESLKDYEHPEDVEVPDFREYFENTEDPGFLKVAEAVDRIQHPEEPQEPETQETEAAEEETTEATAEPEPAPVEAEKPETPELPKAPEEAKKPEEPEEPDTPEEPEVPAGE